MKAKSIYTVLLFLLIVNEAFGATGCVLNSSARLFPNYTGTVNQGYRIYHKTGEINGYTTFCYYNTNVLCAMRTLVASECVGCYKEASDPYYYALGQEWVYYTSVNQCPVPLDDYVISLLIAMGGITVLRLRSFALASS